MRVRASFGILALLAVPTAVSLVSMTVANNFAHAEGTAADAAEVAPDPGESPPTTPPVTDDKKAWEDLKRQANQVYAGEEGSLRGECKAPRSWVLNGAPHFGHHACGAENDDGLTPCQIDCGENTLWNCSAVKLKNKGGYGEQCSCCEYPGERLKPKRKLKRKTGK